LIFELVAALVAVDELVALELWSHPLKTNGAAARINKGNLITAM